MPVIRTCKNCARKNRIPAAHLADTGHCGACKAPLPPVNEALEADPQFFDEVIRDARVPVLVDFWAAWCGPCRMAAPEVARAAADMAGQAVVLKVDTERHPETHTALGPLCEGCMCSGLRFTDQAQPSGLVGYGKRCIAMSRR